MRVVILAALLPEARAIARAFHFPFAAARFGRPFCSAGDLTVGLVGPRAGRLAEVPACEPQALIMAGLGGALAPDLALGDVILHGDALPAIPLARPGRLLTITDILATPEAKAAAFRETGALAVDMETQPAEALARRLGIPFLAVRAISDTSDESLDPSLLSLVDAEGRPRLGRAMGLLAGQPGRLGELLRLRRASNLALDRLGAALVAIIQSGWPDPK